MKPGFGAPVRVARFAEAQGFSRRFPIAILCLDDISSLDVFLIMDPVRAHPKILIDGMPLNDLGYIPPGGFFDR